MAVGPWRRHLRAGWRPSPPRRPGAMTRAVGVAVAGRLSSKQPGGRLARKACPSGWPLGRLPSHGPRSSGCPRSYAAADPRPARSQCAGFSLPGALPVHDAIGSDRLGVLDYGEIGRCRIGEGATAAGRRKQRDPRPVSRSPPAPGEFEGRAGRYCAGIAACERRRSFGYRRRWEDPGRGCEQRWRRATASVSGGRPGTPGGPARGRPARPEGRPRPRPGRRPRQAPPGRGRRGRGGRRRRRWPPRSPGRR
jgi:hypothetical protein